MSKRKKTEKQKDFAKKKLKVGKTAAKPDNHTDTSFVAKTISIPNQSIAQRKPGGTASSSSSVTTQNNPNDKSNDKKSANIDWTHQFQLVRHHSPQTRAEVLGYIEKHLPSNNPLIYRQLITAIIPLIVDPSNNVRNALIQLMNSSARIQPDILELNVKGLLLFVHSAMTHIQPDIRNSSSKFLNVLIENASTALLKSHFVKTMKCYFSLLAWPLKDDKKSVLLAITTSASTGGSTKKARIHHIHILNNFLLAALFDDSQATTIIDGNNTVLIHPQSGKYLFPNFSRPFAPLKLFVKEINGVNGANNSHGLNSDDGKYTLEDLNSLSTEDMATRRKVVLDVFFSPMMKNLKSLVKEGGEVGREARSLEVLLEKLVKDTEEAEAKE